MLHPIHQQPALLPVRTRVSDTKLNVTAKVRMYNIYERVEKMAADLPPSYFLEKIVGIDFARSAPCRLPVTRVYSTSVLISIAFPERKRAA